MFCQDLSIIFCVEKEYISIKFIGDRMKYKCLEKLGLNKKNEKKNKVLSILNKTFMAIFLGLVFLITMEYSPKFKSFMQDKVLGKDLSFGLIGKLYNKYFGEVLPEGNPENLVEVFNEKLTFSRKEKYVDGYKLSVTKNYLVPVLQSGVVVFLGNNDDYGKVITIEGEDGSTITYGNILNTDFKLYDYVSKEKFLGEVDGEFLYIVIKKDGKYQDLETYLS